MKTVLFDRHRALGAKIVDFAGWEMPVHYSSIIQEHLAVRQGVGIFDVSHMGRISITGKQAALFLDFLSTNSISDKKDWTATYTVFCSPSGGAVDDLIVYRQHAEHFFVIVNAGNRQKDLHHLQTQAARFDVQIREHYEEEGILAIQGPKADSLVQRLFPEAQGIAPMHFLSAVYQGEPLILSKTGYTGSGGFEIYAPLSLIVSLWDLFFKEGAAEQIVPVGLGARDTLRLEKGYVLYGHELTEEIAPTESIAAWTVKWNQRDFLGKKALLELQNSPTKRNEYGVVLLDRGVAREGYEVYQEGKLRGQVTSGTFSPSLNQAIAVILVQGILSIGEIVEIKIRENLVKAEVVRLPFLK